MPGATVATPSVPTTTTLTQKYGIADEALAMPWEQSQGYGAVKKRSAWTVPDDSPDAKYWVKKRNVGFEYKVLKTRTVWTKVPTTYKPYGSGADWLDEAAMKAAAWKQLEFLVHQASVNGTELHLAKAMFRPPTYGQDLSPFMQPLRKVMQDFGAVDAKLPAEGATLEAREGPGQGAAQGDGRQPRDGRAGRHGTVADARRRTARRVGRPSSRPRWPASASRRRLLPTRSPRRTGSTRRRSTTWSLA